MNNNPGMDNDKQFEKTQSRTGNPDNEKILKEYREKHDHSSEGGALSEQVQQSDEKTNLKDESENERT